MEDIIKREPREVINEYVSKEESANVTIGLRPSGVIHLGNMATMGLAGYIASEIGPHLSQLNLAVCDLDMPDKKDWSVSKNRYMKYFGSLPDKHGCHDSLLNHAREGIDTFAKGLEGELGIRTNVELLSDIQKQEGFRKGLKRVLDAHLTRYLNPRISSDKSLVFPLCPECHTSNPSPSEYSEGILKTSCVNPDCNQEQYHVDVLDTDFDLAVHYFIDPLRDRLVEPSSSIHVFGGDYFSESGGREKLDKIVKVMEKAGEGDIPEIIVGPAFYGADGSQMSKGRENGLTIDKLFEHFGSEDVVPRVLDVVRWADSQGIRVLDFSIAKDILFGRKR
jgi:hypothetical protein